MTADIIKIHVGLSRGLQRRLAEAGPAAVADFATRELKLRNVRQERLGSFGILVGEAPAPEINNIRRVPGVDFVEADSEKKAVGQQRRPTAGR